MKRTILLTTLITTLFVTTASAQDTFEAPGASVSDGKLSVELEERDGWATLALPINGEVPLDQITDDGCDIQGDTAYGFEGEGTSSETINGMRGYAIELGSDCTAEIETSYINGSLDTSLPDNGWTVFSAPGEMTVNDLELETDCNFNGYEGTNVFEITLDEGNIPLNSSDTLEGTGIYWIRVSGDDCRLDPNDLPFGTSEEEQDGSDDDSGDSGDGSDSGNGNGDFSFEINPDPSEWTDDSNSRVTCEERTRYRGEYGGTEYWTQCAVDAEFEVQAEEGRLEDLKVEADIDNRGSDPDPFESRCESDSTSCNVSHIDSVDTTDIDSYSASIEVQRCESDPQDCSWETVEREEFSNFQ